MRTCENNHSISCKTPVKPFIYRYLTCIYININQGPYIFLMITKWTILSHDCSGNLQQSSLPISIGRAFLVSSLTPISESTNSPLSGFLIILFNSIRRSHQKYITTPLELTWEHVWSFRFFVQRYRSRSKGD